MKPNPKADENRLLACANYAVNHDAFPTSQIEALARRIANHTPCTPEMVRDYLAGVRSLGYFEREALEFLVTAYEKNTGREITGA